MRERVKALSFSLFDSGETILGALIFSTFFPLYITKQVDPKVYSFFYGLVFLVSFLFALQFGKIADRKAIRKEFFTLFVILTVLLSFSLFFLVDFPILSLIVFCLMAVSHQQTFVFYNSLLLDFQKRGFTSGLGVSFGYIGSATALTFLAEKLSVPWVYVVTGALFLILSLPSILFLENPSMKEEVSLKDVFKDRRFILVILSILFLTEVANALISLMGIYLKKVFGFEDVFIYKVIGFSAIGGIIGGIVWGLLVDKLSARSLFPTGFLFWSIIFLSLPLLNRDWIFYFGAFIGFSLAHLWTVSRVYIVEEFPACQISTRMSFLSLTERIASTTGLIIWSALLFITEDNYILSASLMTVFPVIGFLVFLVSKRTT